MRKRDVAIAAAVNAVALKLEDVRPGDIGVAHSRGLLGWLIRVGTRSHWNHAFVVVEKGATADTTWVVQAEARGVERAKLSAVAPGGYVGILRCPSDVDRSLVVAQAEALVDEHYAFLVIFSIAVNILVPFLRVQVQRPGTLICSAVAAISLHLGGYRHPWPDLYAVTPAEIAVALSASTLKTERHPQ